MGPAIGMMAKKDPSRCVISKKIHIDLVEQPGQLQKLRRSKQGIRKLEVWDWLYYAFRSFPLV